MSQQQDLKVDKLLFYPRINRIYRQWTKDSRGSSSSWNGASCLCFPSNKADDEATTYTKSGAVQLHLLGFEMSDTVMLLTKSGKLFICSSPKKIDIISDLAGKGVDPDNAGVEVVLLERTKEDGNAANHEKMLLAIKEGGSPAKMGTLLKEQFTGALAKSWFEAVEQEGIEKVDITAALAYLMAVKDAQELENMKKASVLSNKAMKHVFIDKMQDVIEDDKAITHEKLAEEVEAAIEDPSKMNLKVNADLLESCYFPIIQSGGEYNLKASAASDTNKLQHDIIICSLGARYKNYCGNISRSFFVDVPKRVEQVYKALLTVQTKCLDAMKPGESINQMVEVARSYLAERHSDLIPHLTKHLGYAIGLDFRDGDMLISSKNTQKLKEGMVFNLAMGFHDVPLSAKERKTSNFKMDKFSVLLADVIVIKKDQVPEVMTKCGKEWTDVSYRLDAEKGSGDDSGDQSDDGEEDNGPKLAGGRHVDEAAGVVRSSRLREKTGSAEAQEAIAAREERMAALLKRKAKEKAAQMAKSSKGKGTEEDEEEAVEELEVYKSAEDYPEKTMPNQLYVDMQKECVLVPINGQPVAFSIHTIKNVVMPEPDARSFYLRINFFTPGQSLGKEASRIMAKLVEKRAYQTFVRELTYRSLEEKNLQTAYRQILELRKRLKTKEQREVEEADLVVQAKLIRLKDQRIHKLADLTLRPNMQGKTTGSLEAHVNGLRFTSNKGSLDVLYTNVKHAFFQPCEGQDTKVVLHFHLKNNIMVGKKAHKDIQVYTEAVDSTVNLDGARRSHYDPDEIMEEQRDRQMRKRLNQAFKDFAAKVTKVAKTHGHDIEFDIPFKDLGFNGTPFKEMVFVQPTTYALINVTDQPFFVVPLDEIEHVHFERVMASSKSCDMKIITTENMKEGGGLPKNVNMIEQHKYLQMIMSWLEDASITYTSSARPWNWQNMLGDIRQDPSFYKDIDENGDKKPAGWARLRMDGSDDEDSDEDEHSDENFELDDEQDEDDEESEESFDSDDDDESEFGGEDELSEEGEDWDQLEKKAAASDRARSNWEGNEQEDADDRGGRGGKRGSGGGGKGAGKGGGSSGGGSAANGKKRSGGGGGGRQNERPQKRRR